MYFLVIDERRGFKPYLLYIFWSAVIICILGTATQHEIELIIVFLPYKKLALCFLLELT